MTNDAVYEAALKRIEELSEELQRVEPLLQEKRELEAFVETYSRISKALTRAPERHVRIPAQPAKVSSTEEVVNAAMDILSRRGPLKLGTLYDALIAQGIVIGGKIPRNNLGAKLSADFRLESRKDVGWWFKDEPLPSSVLPEIVELQESLGESPVIHGAPVNGTLGAV